MPSAFDRCHVDLLHWFTICLRSHRRKSDLERIFHDGCRCYGFWSVQFDCRYNIYRSGVATHTCIQCAGTMPLK
ncbi:hypothetical protein TELCIR_16262 [Teladorsagia circumcincta]|uniref:Uncharacterized protein n=1 Tax=Teladorsagia circumcincta TaxID=45464 RepID=A0A2G9TY75_TELCI|nr:hypothetical protein TELCIR_16262 [Teladorsagia circumcincta]